jgi:hypothetical protein
MTSRALALALCLPCAAQAAPVPPPRLVTAEAVVKPPQGNPRDLAAKLVSAPFLAGVAKSPTALGPLRWERDPAAWLAARLKAAVDPDRGTVTLRLEGCPRREAVALLSAVVEAYKGDALKRGELAAAQAAQREVLVQLVIAQRNAQAGGAIQVIAANNLDFDLAPAGPTKAAVDKGVLQAPRIVQPGLPGKGRPPR